MGISSRADEYSASSGRARSGRSAAKWPRRTSPSIENQSPARTIVAATHSDVAARRNGCLACAAECASRADISQRHIAIGEDVRAEPWAGSTKSSAIQHSISGSACAPLCDAY